MLAIGCRSESGKTAAPTPAQTPTPCLSVSVAPVVLFSSTCYRLTQDIVVNDPSVAAIRFAASGGSLDLNGYELSCVGCGASYAQVGVSAREKSGITVHNGTIRGFTYGIRIDDNGYYDDIAADDPLAASNITVRDLETVDNTFRGIRIEARDAVVENCTVRGTGPGSADGSLVMGIEVYGPRPEIRRNIVLGTQAPLGGEGVGISVSDWGNDAVVEGNKIMIAEPVAGADYGIWVGGESDVIVSGNLVDSYSTGIAFSSPTSGKYLDNDVQRAITPYLISSPNVSGDVPP